MRDEFPAWLTAIGAGLLMCFFGAIALVAAGGWKWFADFLVGAAPAWIQAFGSIAAIAAAAWLASSQERKRLVREKQIAVLKARHFAGALNGLATSAVGVRPRLHSIRTIRVVLEEVIADSRTIQSEQLNLRWIVAVSALRSIALQMMQALKECEIPNGTDGNFEAVDLKMHEYTQNLLVGLKEKLQEQMNVIRVQHPGVPDFRGLNGVE